MSMVDVMPLDGIPPGQMVRVEVGGQPVCVANVNGTLHAVHDTCTHAMASLSAGWLDPDTGRIECPRHGAAFRLEDGAALTPPATAAVPVFPVEVQDGRVLIGAVPSTPHPFDTE